MSLLVTLTKLIAVELIVLVYTVQGHRLKNRERQEASVVAYRLEMLLTRDIHLDVITLINGIRDEQCIPVV